MRSRTLPASKSLRIRLAWAGAAAVLSVAAVVSCLPDDGAWGGRYDYAPDPEGGATGDGASGEGGGDAKTDGGDSAADAGEAAPEVLPDNLVNVVRGRIASLAVTPAEAVVRIADDD